MKYSQPKELKIFMKWLDNQDAHGEPVLSEFISILSENMREPPLNQLNSVGAYKVSHDQCMQLPEDDEYVIIGQRRVFIQVRVDTTVDLETPMPMMLCYDTFQYVLEKAISNHMQGLITLEECKYYLLQNTCNCC